MKTVLLALFIYLVKSRCFRFPEVTTTEYYVPVVNIDGINESVMYIMNENNTDDNLSSLITGIYSDQPITVLSGEGYKMARKARLNRHSNSIILTNNLILDELYSDAFNKMLKWHWSPLYIIITTKNGTQSCENGTVSQLFLENAQDYMNTIWHKHQIFRVIVSFPYTCPHYFIIYSGNKPSNTTLYDRTIKVIKAKNKQELKTAILVNSKPQELTVGYPLRASIFYRFPTSITQCDTLTFLLKLNLKLSNGFCGLDGLLMHEFIKHFQYNLTIPEDERCNVYGFVHPDKNVSGSLGCIIRDQIDISFNSRFVVHYATRNFFYLHYVTVDSLAVVLKRPEVIPLWHYAYSTYGPRTGTVVAIVVIAVGVLMWIIAWLTRQSTNHKPRQLHEYILSAMTCTLFGFVIERNSKQFRLLKGTCLFCSIVFLAVYQGNVNYQFTTRTRYSDLKTLQQLFHSKYVLYTSPSIRDLLMSSVNAEDTAQVAYLQRIQTKNESVVGIKFIIEHPEAATLERGEDIQMEILLNYTDKNGAPIMYAIEETFHVYYMSYIARSGFLFVEESLQFMMRMLEAGLPRKYYAWTRSTLKLGDTNPKSGPEPRPISKIELNDLRVAFCVLVLGCFVSTCLFIAEIYKVKLTNNVINTS